MLPKSRERRIEPEKAELRSPFLSGRIGDEETQSRERGSPDLEPNPPTDDLNRDEAKEDSPSIKQEEETKATEGTPPKKLPPLPLRSHTEEANHSPTSFIAAHFLNSDGQPDRLKTLVPIVMHGLRRPDLVKEEAERVGLKVRVYYLGELGEGQETAREQGPFLIVGWTRALVEVAVGMLDGIENGEVEAGE